MGTLRVILLLLLLGAEARAANYYVDYVGGSDSNVGTATNAAWKHCPGDTAATSTAGSATLAAGDAVFFKGGVSYLVPTNATLMIGWSGSAGSPITYDGNSAGTWGSGRAIITDNYAVEPVGGRSIIDESIARSWIVIKNIEFYALGGSASLPTDTGSAVPANRAVAIYFSSGCTNVTVDNCYFHEIGYWFNQKPMDDNSISGNAIRTMDSVNLTITNCEFTKVSIALEINSATLTTNLNIGNCKFHDYIRWGVDLAPTAQGVVENGIWIHDCEFYNYFQFDTPYWTAYGEWPHTDGIFYRCDFDYVTMTNVYIFNNLFWATNEVAGGTASIYVTEGGSCRIYNNVFQNSRKGRTIYFMDGPFAHGAAPQKVEVFNNSFYEGYTQQIDIEDSGTGRPVQGVTVRNNSFYDYYQGSSNNRIIYIISTNTALYSFDYNSYKSFNTLGQFFYCNTNSTTVGGTNQMQAVFGWETHGLEVDPAYVSTNNLHLQASSPLRNSGTNLYTTFTTDKDLQPRPAVGAWDIGAYQYSGGGGGSVTRTARGNSARIGILRGP